MSLAQPRILVADDQPDVVEALRLLLKANGFSVVPTSSPAATWDSSSSATTCWTT